MAKPLSEMSERELESAYKKESDTGSKLTDEMISAGRGTERPTETRTKDDELSRKYNSHMDRMQAIVGEQRERERYQGNRKPIKRHRWG